MEEERFKLVVVPKRCEFDFFENKFNFCTVECVVFVASNAARICPVSFLIDLIDLCYSNKIWWIHKIFAGKFTLVEILAPCYNPTNLFGISSHIAELPELRH